MEKAVVESKSCEMEKAKGKSAFGAERAILD